MGRCKARVRGDKILPVHAVRFGVYAAGDGGFVLLGKGPGNGLPYL